jgi:predicted ArsR family transcriptional regulator
MKDDLLKTSKALGDETRLAIYRFLGTGEKGSSSVQQLAAHFKLHPNAVRQHLGKLEEAGLVASETGRPAGFGRPQRMYKLKGPFHDSQLLPRDYRLLSEMLLEFVASKGISAADIKAFGGEWGKRRVKTQLDQSSSPRSSEEIARIMSNLFSGLGFEPALRSVSDQTIDLRLHNCIFREVVEFHPDLVCAMLHGVLEGMLSPFIGHPNTGLENGIAHGRETCTVLVSLKP